MCAVEDGLSSARKVAPTPAAAGARPPDDYAGGLAAAPLTGE